MNFYLRLLKRQARLPAIRLFTVAVMLACAVTFSITLLSDRLETLFQDQSKEVLASDLLLRSTSPITEHQQKLIDTFTGQKAQTLIFQTMASSEDGFILSAVKAVTDSYPLKGELQISDELFGQASAISHGPSPGKVWVEDRILMELEINIGDEIEIGKSVFTIDKVLVYEPDKGNSFYSFTPRIFMHHNDVAATEVIQLGSRASYNYLFASENPQALEQIQTSLEKVLEPNQKFVTIESANETLANTLKRAYQFLTITALIAVLLGATGVALVSYQYSAEMTYQYAVLRCLGLRGWQLRSAIIFPFMLFTLVAIALGLLLGGGTHFIIIESLASILPKQLPNPSAQPFIISSLTALLVVLSFAWPFLKELITAPPKILLSAVENREQNILPTLISISFGLLLVVYLNIQEVTISLYIILGLAAFILLSFVLTRILVSAIQQANRNSSGQTKLSIRLFTANRRIGSLQIVAIAITFFSLALIQTLRDDLIDSWQAKVPVDAPNYFAINLFDDELESFKTKATALKAELNPLYPVIRGRLTELNGIKLRDTVEKDSRSDRATDRDLSLTWATELPHENEIIEGQWLDADSDQYETSVEQDLAEDMGIKIGDELTFVIETQAIKVTVTSIRTVSWESFTPNFYFMFNQKAIEQFPATYLSSFYLPDESKKQLPELMSNYPSASFFDVDFLLKRVRSIIAQVGFAVESILYFALAASIIVFIAIEMILHHNRLYTTAILKAAGSKVSQIQKLFRNQFILIGLLSGVLAYLLNNVVSYITTVFVMQSQYVFNWKVMLLCLIATPLLVLLIGQLSIKRTRDVSAKELLNE